MQLLPRMERIATERMEATMPAVVSAADGEEDEEAAGAVRRPPHSNVAQLLLVLLVGIATGSVGTYFALARRDGGGAYCAPSVRAGSSTASDRIPFGLVDWLLEPIDALEAKYGTLSEDRVWCISTTDDCGDPVGWLALLAGGEKGFLGGHCHVERAGSDTETHDLKLGRWPATSAGAPASAGASDRPGIGRQG